MELSIDRKNGVPLYKQIVEQVTMLIRGGVLKNGDRLPTERALAQKYRLSLGTVKTAYSALALSCLIESIQGRGTFVNNSGLPAGSPGRLKQAADIISAYLDRLAGLPLPLEEAEELIREAFEARYEQTTLVRVAVITCCEDFLENTLKTVAALPGASVSGLLTPEVDAARERLINDIDLIITAPGHAEELAAAVPVLEDKIVKISYSFDEASLARIAVLGPSARPVILARTGHSLETLRAHLAELEPALTEGPGLAAEDDPDLSRILKGRDFLMAPSSWPSFATPGQKAALAEFEKSGGVLASLDFQIDAGSIPYIGSEVARIAMQKSGLFR